MKDSRLKVAEKFTIFESHPKKVSFYTFEFSRQNSTYFKKMWNSCFLSKLKKDQKFKWFFTRSWDQMWIVQWTSLLSSIVKSWVFQCSCHVSSVQDWSQVMAAQVTSTLLLWHQIAYQEGYCFETPHWHCSSSFCEQLCNEYA